MISNKRSFYCRFIFLWMMTIGLCFGVQHKTALAEAARHGSGVYQMSAVTLSTSTVPYGGEGMVLLEAQMTVPDGAPPVDYTRFYFMIDSYFYQVSGSGSAPVYTLAVNGISLQKPLAIGQHTIYAEYYEPGLGGVRVDGPSTTLTVVKDTPTNFVCNATVATTNLPNTPLTISFSLSRNSNLQVDWQNATFTVAFVGKQTFTHANLKPNSSEEVTVSMPSVPDKYTVQCIFNGTSLFNSVTSGLLVPVLVSEKNQIGEIQLYTNPTTIQAGAPVTWEVVVVGEAGLPAPTGQVNLTIGASYTGLITLEPDGSVTFSANAPSPLAQTITVFYDGDGVYAEGKATFSLTNPPIPTNGGNGSQPMPTPTNGAGVAGTPSVVASANGAGVAGTPSVVASANATHVVSATRTADVLATPTSSALRANVALSNSLSTGASADEGNVILWIVFAVVVLVALGVVVGVVVFRRRRVPTVVQGEQESTVVQGGLESTVVQGEQESTVVQGDLGTEVQGEQENTEG